MEQLTLEKMETIVGGVENTNCAGIWELLWTTNSAQIQAYCIEIMINFCND